MFNFVFLRVLPLLIFVYLRPIGLAWFTKGCVLRYTIFLLPTGHKTVKYPTRRRGDKVVTSMILFEFYSIVALPTHVSVTFILVVKRIMSCMCTRSGIIHGAMWLRCVNLWTVNMSNGIIVISNSRSVVIKGIS